MNPGTSALNPMTIPSHRAAAAAHHSNGADRSAVLTSWTDIARYMGKGVRTVQRWEQDFGLPVRRPQGSNKKAVLARPRDLDAWVALRCTSRAERVPIDGSGWINFARPSLSLTALSLLNARIETARLLRDNNLALTKEVKAAVEELRSRVESIQQLRF
jgi:hypothetical protein